jgi:VIT1/CCC1 family predicted Fe2+/Mn2+ transporter
MSALPESTRLGDATAAPVRAAILDPVDRVSEILFGLLMALSFTGAISVSSPGEEDVRTVLFAALGCNLAWGLVDAVMYVVRTQVSRGHRLAVLRSIRGAADPATANALVAGALPEGWAGALPRESIDAIRDQVRALPEPPLRPPLRRQDLLAAIAIFLLVVLATFPVVIPFMVFEHLPLAMRVSNGVAIAMLFAAGLALGRHADIGAARTGLGMVALGVVMVAAIMLFGG